MKYLLLCLALLIISGATAQERPLVVSSASMIQDIAQHIGGDRFRYEMIVPIGGDPHIYEPTPSDAQLCARANLLLRNGLTFEGWIAKLIENSGSAAPVVTVSDGVTPIASSVYANATDPHAWMDATNGIIYAQNILRAMQSILPADSALFMQNFEAYRSQLQELDAYILNKIQSIPESKRILITSHDAFHYYGKKYGLRLESILGTSTDADVQTADIRRLNAVIRSTDVPAVFVESTVNPQMLRQIADDNGIAVGGKLFADSLGEKDGPASTYQDMLKHNTDTIYEGLMRARDRGTGSESNSGPSWLFIILIAPVVLIAAYFILKIVRR